MTQPNENGNAAAIHDLVSAAKNTMRHLIDLRTDLRQSKYQAFQRSPVNVVEDAHEAIRLLYVRVESLTTERNALAERVAALEADAEVGRELMKFFVADERREVHIEYEDVDSWMIDVNPPTVDGVEYAINSWSGRKLLPLLKVATSGGLAKAIQEQALSQGEES